MQNYPRGLVKGPGTGTSDSIVARISNGEYILPKAAVDMIGKQKLDKLKNAANALHPLPRFAMGGSLNVTSGFGGQQNDMSLTDSMNRASATLKSMQTPTAAPEPTQDQKMMDAFKTFSGMFSGGNTTTPAAAPVEQKPDFMGISQKQELPKFAGGGSVNEVERARQALLRRDKPTPPLEVQRAQAAIQQREAAVPKLQTPVGAELPNLGGKPAIPNSAAKLQYPTGEVAPNLASNKPTAPIKVESAPILTGNTSTVAKPGVPTPSVATPAMQAEIAAQKAAAAQAETGRSIASRFQNFNKGEALRAATPQISKFMSTVGKGAKVAGPYLGAALTAADIYNRVTTSKPQEQLRNDLSNVLDSRGLGASESAMFAENNSSNEKTMGEASRDSARTGIATVRAKRQTTQEGLRENRGGDSYDRLIKTGKKGDASNFLPSKEAIASVLPGKPGDVAAPKVTTSNEETNPLRQARLTNGSMSEAPASVYKDLGTSNADLIKNAAPGQESRATIATSGSKAAGFMPDGRDKFETNYAVRGDNGGSGTVKISGPSQRVGGGTVSVMDQGNGGTVEGNVASLTRQADAMRSLRETMNPGITTGTGQFGPRAAEPVDPFSRPTDGNGDAAGRRSQYEGLIRSANDSGLTAKQRATRLAAAEAMIAPGQEAAKLQNASSMNESDNATRDRATAAQRMNSQLDAESQAAQRRQAQQNVDRSYGLQVRQQGFNELEKSYADSRAGTAQAINEAKLANESYSAPVDKYMEQFKKKDGGYSRDRASVIKGLGYVFGSGRLNKPGADYSTAYNKGEYIPPQIIDSALAEYDDFLQNGEKPWIGSPETIDKYLIRKGKKEKEDAAAAPK